MKKNLTTKVKTNVNALRTPVLRMSPTAWAKLLHLRDVGDTEIGGFGISAADDLLFVEDVQLVAQRCSWSHVAFDDRSVAEFFERQVGAGRRPEQFARIWIHTHPGSSADPSLTDEATFDRVFGRVDWAVMFILARAGQTYRRLRYNVGPRADVELASEVDFSCPFLGSNTPEWNAEYLANVEAITDAPTSLAIGRPSSLATKRAAIDDDWRDAWTEYSQLDDLEGVYGFVRDF